MRRWLPERWLISALFGPVAVLVAVATVHWSQFASAAALVAPALVLAWGLAPPNVLGSYLLSVSLTALAFVLGVYSGHSPIAGLALPLVVAPVLCALLAICCQLLLGARVRRWAAAMGAGLAGVGAALLLGLVLEPSGGWPRAPDELAVIPACSAGYSEYTTPAGHQSRRRITETERVAAIRDCDASSGFMDVKIDDQQTSVFVNNYEPVVIWREPSGLLLVEQNGLPMRALTPAGAVKLSPSLSRWSPSAPPHVLQATGASMLLVGLALMLVLRSLRAQRLLAGGLVGHVEAGRFFPRDGHLTPVSVTGVYANGPALLFGAGRRASYRDGGGSPVRVLHGTLRELVLGHHARRFRACALALCAVLFVWIGVAADLGRLH
jgi:hypothetical protein